MKDHFRQKPALVVSLYRKFEDLIRRCGPSRRSVTKTATSLNGKRRIFADTKLTHRTQDGFLDMTRIVKDDSRFIWSAKHTAAVFVNHFRISQIDDLDDTFAKLVQEAYNVGEGQQLQQFE